MKITNHSDAKRVNIDIDAQLWHAVSVFAALNQQAKRDIVEAALKHWLKINQNDMTAYYFDHFKK